MEVKPEQIYCNNYRRYKIITVTSDAIIYVSEVFRWWDSHLQSISPSKFLKLISDGNVWLAGNEPIKTGGSRLCKHEYKLYVGIFETYKYCTFCDCKLEVAV